MPLASHSGPKCASIAAGSNDLARLSRPGVRGAAIAVVPVPGEVAAIAAIAAIAVVGETGAVVMVK